jgi:hypothetical protein
MAESGGARIASTRNNGAKMADLDAAAAFGCRVRNCNCNGSGGSTLHAFAVDAVGCRTIAFILGVIVVPVAITFIAIRFAHGRNLIAVGLPSPHKNSSDPDSGAR